jgi:hypothetical protein
MNLDAVPASLRTSTTGQGLAGVVATAAGSIAAHYNAPPEVVAAVATLAGALVLILFPQEAAKAPVQVQVAAADIETVISAMRFGHSLAKAAPAAPVLAPTTQETPHA